MKTKKIPLLLFILFIMTFSHIVFAKTFNRSEIENNCYVIGTHLFCPNSSGSYDNPDLFNGTINVAQIMLGSSTGDYSEITKASDFKILQKITEGLWMDTISGTPYNSGNIEGNIPETFEITHKNGTCIEEGGCDKKESSNTFNVTFTNRDDEAEENYITETTIKIVAGEKISYPDVISKTKPGSRFKCWTNKANGDDECFAEIVNEEITLVPVWEPIKYTINFDLNGASGTEIESKTCDVALMDVYKTEANESNCTFPKVDPLQVTKTGYKFVGWSTNKETPLYEYKDAYEEGESIVPALGSSDNITFYAVWEPEDYKITYNLDGGTYGKETVVIGTYNDLNREIAIFKPSKPGYTFKEWTFEVESAADGEDTKVTINDTTNIQIDETLFKNIVLKATWEPITYSFTYVKDNIQNIESFNSDTSCKYGDTCTLNETIPKSTSNNDAFYGWRDEEGNLYSAKEDVSNRFTETQEEPIKLTAMFLGEVQKTITYHLDGGTFEGDFITKYTPSEEPESQPLNLPTPSKTGYHFDGWYTKDPKGQEEIESFKYNESNQTEDIEVWAKWTANTYSIVLHKSDVGHSELKTITCTYDVDCSLEDNNASFEEEHLILEGWATNESAEEVFYVDNLKLKNVVTGSEEDNKLDLYAVTKPIVYTVTYYLNGGTATINPENKNYSYDATINLPDTPTREGYEFKGWYEVNEDGSTTETKYEGTEQVQKNITLIAVWEEKVKHSINYFLDGGKFEELTYDTQTSQSTYKPVEAPTTADDNAEITIPNPHRLGYEFKGWKKSSLDTTEYDSIGEDTEDMKGKKITVTEDLLLVAQWEERKNPEVKAEFPEKMEINQEYEFKISNIAGKNEGKQVIVRATFTTERDEPALEKINDLKYCAHYNEDGETCKVDGYETFPVEVKDEDNKTIYFGNPYTGFPLYDLTSIFKATFTEEGTYKIKVEVLEWTTDFANTKTSGQVLSSIEETITISAAE